MRETDRALRSWAAPFPDRVWAIESARGLGYLLAQQLVAAGETVVDVPAVLSTRTRLLGSGKSQKNDPNDARSVAIAALRNDGLQRVTGDDHPQVLKLLAKRHRDLARQKSQASCRLHALLMELAPGGMAKEMTVTRANDILDRVIVDSPTTQHRRRGGTRVRCRHRPLRSPDEGVTETAAAGGGGIGNIVDRHPRCRRGRCSADHRPRR
jgi:transposase